MSRMLRSHFPQCPGQFFKFFIIRVKLAGFLLRLACCQTTTKPSPPPPQPQPRPGLRLPPDLKHTAEISRACPPETVPPPCPATLTVTQNPPPAARTHPRLKPSGLRVKGSLSAPVGCRPLLKSTPRIKKPSRVSDINALGKKVEALC